MLKVHSSCSRSQRRKPMIFFLLFFLISLFSYFLYLIILSIPPFFLLHPFLLSSPCFSRFLLQLMTEDDVKILNVLKFTVFCGVTPCNLVRTNVSQHYLHVGRGISFTFLPWSWRQHVTTEHAGVAVTLGTSFRNVVGWNLRSDTRGPEVFRGLVQSLQTYAKIMPRLTPSKCIQVHYSWIILPFDAVYFRYWERLKVKHKKRVHPNVSKHLPDTLSHPRRQQSWWSPLWEPQSSPNHTLDGVGTLLSVRSCSPWTSLILLSVSDSFHTSVKVRP
jgi:hypothetical protein